MSDDIEQSLEQMRDQAGASDAAPAFLLADSRLLFGRLGKDSFAERVASCLRPGSWVSGPRGAYLGAGTGDEPAYYEIFEAFAESTGCVDLCHVKAEPSDGERTFLAEADLVVIGGGDIERGWNAFETAGLTELLRASFLGGAVHVGVSAGATTLGLGACDAGGDFLQLLGLVPLVVGTGEASIEDALSPVVRAAPMGRGIGIPLGGGAVYHPDGTLEPLASVLSELFRDADGTLRAANLLPPDLAEESEEPGD